MAKLLKIGIVGCGAIGTSLGKAIVKDFTGSARLFGFYDIDARKSGKLAELLKMPDSLVASGLKQLIARCDLIIEAASANSSWEIVRTSLSGGCDVMIMSVGGIVKHAGMLFDLAQRYNTRVFIPSGAIAGIDAVKAASLGRIKSVVLTTRKNPRSFEGVKYVERKKIRLDSIKRDTVLFCGTARDAVKFFPQNINVAGILSIAGSGQDKTKVKIVASVGLTRNIHEIEVESESGRIFARTENVVHPDNPKTSYLAVLSAIATLKQVLGPVRIGT